MRFTYRNDLGELEKLAADVESFAEQQGVDPAMAQTLNLCLDEVFTNIVSYGYTDAEAHQIFLELTVTAAEIAATIRDDARAFDPLTEAPIPDLDAPLEERQIGGLGVHFVKKLMTRVSYRREDGWNVLEMVRAR